MTNEEKCILDLRRWIGIRKAKNYSVDTLERAMSIVQEHIILKTRYKQLEEHYTEYKQIADEARELLRQLQEQ